MDLNSHCRSQAICSRLEKFQKCLESFYNGDIVQQLNLLTHIASYHTWQYHQVGKGFCYVRQNLTLRV